MRNHWHITRSVWKALLLRESLSRMFGTRLAWVWLLVEPMVHVGFMMVMFTMIRIRQVGGFETPMWILLGLLSFFYFKRTFAQTQNAVNANRSLYAYRQVKPIDAVLVRAFLEAALMTVISLLMLLVAGMTGLRVLADDPLIAAVAIGCMWVLGLSWGMVASVVIELVPESGHVIKFVMTPLYFMSGVILPLSVVPLPYREWLMLNPLAHGVELVRAGFAEHYHAVPEMSLTYLMGCALVSSFLGLALQRRFHQRLVTQ